VVDIVTARQCFYNGGDDKGKKFPGYVCPIVYVNYSTEKREGNVSDIFQIIVNSSHSSNGSFRHGYDRFGSGYWTCDVYLDMCLYSDKVSPRLFGRDLSTGRSVRSRSCGRVM
jgi:hypothetical protein